MLHQPSHPMMPVASWLRSRWVSGKWTDSQVRHLGSSQRYKGIWMLTAREKTNITYGAVVVLIVSIVRDLSYSVMNRPDIQMAAKAWISLTLMPPGLRKKAGRIPTNVLDVGNVFLVPTVEIQKTPPKSNTIQSFPGLSRLGQIFLL